MQHLNLTVSDLDRAIDFYRGWLGFDGGRRTLPDGTVFLDDGRGFDLALHTGVVDAPPAPAVHFGVRHPRPETVRDLRDRMSSAGVRIVESDDEADDVSFKCLDPDGYVVEVYFETPRRSASPRVDPSQARITAAFDDGWLDVGDGHVLFYEQVGNPVGTPIVYLHGGPGSGSTPGARLHFDATRHRAVLFDQRAAGRSTPHASTAIVDWQSIDMDHHVGDIERLREHLGIDRWIVFGLSWGSVLGATYAQRHPDRVSAVVLGAVSTGTAADVDWITVDAGRFFPAEWQAFHDHVPPHLRARRLVDAYHTLLMDPDPAIHEAAAAAWCRWEDAHVATTPGARPNPRYDDPAFRLGFARQVTHCWRHDSWLAPDEIVTNAGTLAGIPGWLIHGRLDVSSPLDCAWRIHRAWPGSELIIVDDEGHGGDTMVHRWREILAQLASGTMSL